MRILLTGSKGLLGQDIIVVASSHGHTIIPTDTETLDITSFEEIVKVTEHESPDVIINTAAYNFVDKVEDPATFPLALAINADGPRYLARRAAQLNIPFIHFSTDYVFEGNKPEGYTETDAPNPVSKYGETKYKGEQAIQEEGGQWYICRTSRLFGPPGNSPVSKKDFFSLILDLVKTKPALDIVDEEVGCPTYTYHLAQAAITLLDQHYKPGIYHLVNSGRGVTFYGFAQEITRAANITIPINPVSSAAFAPRPAKRPDFAQLLNTKFPQLPSRIDALKEFLDRQNSTRSDA